MLKHQFVVGESLAAAQHWTLPLLLGRHLVAFIALDGGPDDESMKGALIACCITGPNTQ
jgi:hypothetical protein